ncbi:glycerol-3-phosphate 1-O-acyltransferase PlsY [Synergistaceae bacterium OttesenSCG-928-D05]|nr:glycerol-3-phosphate 1-O-acyltransferase PlsY [Synergistaceae bacterium OttesenSCG-928-D05]
MALVWMIFGYLAGSCPTGYLVVKYIKGVDIRDYGSGNVGATNAGRLLGRNWGIAIALFDMLKGGIMVWIAYLAGASDMTMALTGVMSVLGHNYPAWLNFRGGKGVATTFGVFAFFDFFNPWCALLGGVVWYLMLKYAKYVSISSMIGLFVATIAMPVFGMPRPYYIAALFLSCLSVWRHRSNITRILEGSEVKVD